MKLKELRVGESYFVNSLGDRNPVGGTRPAVFLRRLGLPYAAEHILLDNRLWHDLGAGYMWVGSTRQPYDSSIGPGNPPVTAKQDNLRCLQTGVPMAVAIYDQTIPEEKVIEWIPVLVHPLKIVMEWSLLTEMRDAWIDEAKRRVAKEQEEYDTRLSLSKEIDVLAKRLPLTIAPMMQGWVMTDRGYYSNGVSLTVSNTAEQLHALRTLLNIAVNTQSYVDEQLAEMQNEHDQMLEYIKDLEYLLEP